MATSGDVKSTFKQDMVVSTRYRNDLPPPPMPPKLLDIDNGGLAQYLTTSFASGLARREEPNIEVDAEGGIPLDMVGVPGYFLGDESAIMAPEIDPILDPADHALLLTPEQIRKRGATNTNVSFLRKTQYMTSQNARANDVLMRTTPRVSKANHTSKAPIEKPASRDDPSYIKRHIQKGFAIAYPASTPATGAHKPLPIAGSDRDAWRNPTHPSNPKLKPVDFFPLVPDLAAKTDWNSFISVKFDKAPLPALPHGKRDDRIDVAVLHPAKADEVEREWKMRKDAYDKNPDLYEDPGRLAYDWDFCVPRLGGSAATTNSDRSAEVKDVVERVRRKLNVADPARDQSDLYINQEKGRFEYERVRTFAEDSAPMTQPWRFLALNLFDPDDSASSSSLPTSSQSPAPTSSSAPSRLKNSNQGKAAYYYEIGQRMRLKADRVKTLAQARGHGTGKAAAVVANENSVDGIDLLIRAPDEDEVLVRADTRAAIDTVFDQSREMEDLRRRRDEREQLQLQLQLEQGEEEEEDDGYTVTQSAGDIAPLHNGSLANSDAVANGADPGLDDEEPIAAAGAAVVDGDGEAEGEPDDVDMEDADAEGEDE